MDEDEADVQRELAQAEYLRKVAPTMTVPIPSEDDAWQLVMAETTDPDVRQRLLAFRVSVLTREKEALERRVSALELAYNMGRGIFWAAPFIIAMIGFFWYNWTKITSPWTGKTP